MLSNQGVKFPQNPNFGGVNRRFWAKRENFKLSYFRNYGIDCNQILHIDKDQQLSSFVNDPNMPQTNPRWRTTAIFWNRKILTTLQQIDGFDEIWQVMHLEPLDPIKNQNFWNPRWRRPPSWKLKKSWCLRNRWTNFDETWHSDATRPSVSHMPIKIVNFKNPTWRQQPNFLRLIFRFASVSHG